MPLREGADLSYLLKETEKKVKKITTLNIEKYWVFSNNVFTIYFIYVCVYMCVAFASEYFINFYVLKN